MESASDVLNWLKDRPDLQTMRVRFPREWLVVEREIREALLTRSSERLDGLLILNPSTAKHGGRKYRREFALRMVRKRMTVLAIQEMGRMATTNKGARVSEHLLDRWARGLTNGLFQDQQGRKKPVSMRLFNLIWPLVPRREAFIVGEQARGTYCFLSQDFIEALTALIGERRCLEIAAGDGTLTRFLRDGGVSVSATDDMSWGHEIIYPDFVERADAEEAVRRHEPEFVLCSWPPPGNTFEKAVFRTPSVRTYIVMGSRHAFATGARSDYESADGFSMRRDDALARMLLPPQAGHEVLVFERTASASPA